MTTLYKKDLGIGCFCFFFSLRHLAVSHIESTIQNLTLIFYLETLSYSAIMTKQC